MGLLESCGLASLYRCSGCSTVLRPPCDTMVAGTALSPASGPVAVTGASGYIGSWVVEDLVAQGYTVRACVRDKSSVDKTAHILALNSTGARGSVELFEADLNKPGSYDDAFAGCAGVVHTGAAVGFNRETPQVSPCSQRAVVCTLL